MRCKICKKEYETGIVMCPECKVMLEAELDNQLTFISVLSTYNIADIALIKSVLEEEKIDYFFQGENMLILRPHLEPAILKVREDQVEEVIELLKDFDFTYLAWKK